MMKPLKIWLGFLLCLATASRAELLIPLSVEELTERAQLVLQGKVLSQTCQRDSAGRIYTSLDFEITEAWKGAFPEKHLTLVHSGGVLGQERATASSQVAYRVGEEVVVFVVLNQAGQGVTIGMRQGKFSVWEDAATGKKLADNGVHLRARKPQPAQPSLAPVSEPKILTIAELKQRVQAPKP